MHIYNSHDSSFSVLMSVNFRMPTSFLLSHIISHIAVSPFSLVCFLLWGLSQPHTLAPFSSSYNIISINTCPFPSLHILFSHYCAPFLTLLCPLSHITFLFQVCFARWLVDQSRAQRVCWSCPCTSPKCKQASARTQALR